MIKKIKFIERSYGKNIHNGEVPQDAEVQLPDCSPMLEVRSKAGLYEKVRSLSYLFPRTRFER